MTQPLDEAQESTVFPVTMPATMKARLKRIAAEDPTYDSAAQLVRESVLAMHPELRERAEA